MRARGLRPPWAETVVMIDLRLPTGRPLTTSTMRLPLFPPLPAYPPPALSPAPNPPGGRTARWAERRRRPRGFARLRRPERISCRRGSACPACASRAASLSARSFIPWPACARMCWNRLCVTVSATYAAALRSICCSLWGVTTAGGVTCGVPLPARVPGCV